MGFRWCANDGPLLNAGLAALWFFRGSGITLNFVIFQGGGEVRTPCPPLWIRTCLLLCPYICYGLIVLVVSSSDPIVKCCWFVWAYCYFQQFFNNIAKVSYHMGLVGRNPVLGVCDQVRLKQPTQLKRLARILKLGMKHVDLWYYLQRE